MKIEFNRSQLAIAVATALGAATMAAASAQGLRQRSVAAKTKGTYVTGDFHNHTTCSDGSISMQKLVKKSTDKQDTPWGLDWFVQAGHGGNGNRNCTLAEDATLATPAYPLVDRQPTARPCRRPTTTLAEHATRPSNRKGSRAAAAAPNPEHVALAVDPGIPVSAHRVSGGAEEQARCSSAWSRSSPVTSTPRCR